MAKQDLLELENAVRIILSVLQRNKIHNENADARRSQFKMFVNDKERQEEKEQQANKWGILKLTEKEIIKMPKTFREQFRVGKVIAHVRKRTNGVYEVRCTINGNHILGTSKILATAKEKFINALNELPPNPSKPIEHKIAKKSVTLKEYTLKWLEMVKKPMVKPITFKDYTLSCNTNIFPTFGERELSDISQFELQELINSYAEEGKHRTAKKIHQILTAVFEYAIVDDIITKSPMQRVVLPKYEQEHGAPLSREEEKELVEKLQNGGDIYIQAFVFLVYTGLRRSELASVEIENGWITLKTSKQRKWVKEKTRAMPISPMLAPLLPLIDVEAIKMTDVHLFTKWFKKIFPTHHLHDTRHTFITRAQECGIQREIVSLWAGHAADTSMTTLVYTHLGQNKALQEKEMDKFFYKL